MSSLANDWLQRHPQVSRRQLARRLSERVRRSGFTTSASSIQPILGGWKTRARAYVYRAMLAELEGEGSETRAR